jgi:aspartyl-tRNA(Asn)/glutamyl-tRNA(Gln) amidotransferase subunit A
MIIGNAREECAKHDKITRTHRKMRSIAEASEMICRRKLSPVELTRECLDVIRKLNPRLNAFITVTPDSALREAEQAEIEIGSGRWRGPLHGIPLGLKDIIDTAGVRTTAASAVFESRIPPEDAELVTKLKTAGAVCLGKQNLHEFAYGGSSLISHFGPVRNPANPEHIAGGSSGGSAAAVACGMCFAAIGTDTAGSIREPAALCGVVGFKPTYGLVSTEGVVPLSVSLDHAGPITRSVEDAAIMLDALTQSGGRYAQRMQSALNPVTVGIPRRYFYENLDAEVAQAVESAIQILRTLEVEVCEIDVPVSTDRTLQAYESYAFHRDKLGQRELYQPETLRRILTGEHVTAEQYRTAALEQQRFRAEIREIFHEVDFLITPTTPVPAPAISPLMQDPGTLRPMELALLRNTRPVNVWGLPAISVPCGTTSQGLPVGLQIIGPAQGDTEVLQLAYRFEKASNG